MLPPPKKKNHIGIENSQCAELIECLPIEDLLGDIYEQQEISFCYYTFRVLAVIKYGNFSSPIPQIQMRRPDPEESRV